MKALMDSPKAAIESLAANLKGEIIAEGIVSEYEIVTEGRI